MKKQVIWIIVLVAFISGLIAINYFLTNREETQNEPITVSKNIEKEIKEVTEENFREVVLDSGKMVFVDFYADWCEPCHMVSPIIEEIANENTDENLIFVKINVDENRNLASKYNIYAIPTLILIKDGKVIDRRAGVLTKDKLLNFINK